MTEIEMWVTICPGLCRIVQKSHPWITALIYESHPVKSFADLFILRRVSIGLKT